MKLTYDSTDYLVYGAIKLDEDSVWFEASEVYLDSDTNEIPVNLVMLLSSCYSLGSLKLSSPLTILSCLEDLALTEELKHEPVTSFRRS